MRTRRLLPIGVIVAISIAIAAALVVGNAKTACACVGVTSPVDGVVTRVDASGLTDVTGFTIRTADNVPVAFKLGPLENATQFSPGHLKEHEATGMPVRVYFRSSNGGLVVYRLEDAPLPSSSP
jgi:hypothetical protein